MYPFCANSFAVSLPIPAEAPVISATFLLLILVELLSKGIRKMIYFCNQYSKGYQNEL
jgi:hypothetical protein